MTQQELVLSAEFFLRILTAAVCGIVIGYERENRNKEAGIRTHAIVALGAALIMIVSKYGFSDIQNYDASRVAAQIVSGIGFLGAGIIFIRNRAVSGRRRPVSGPRQGWEWRWVPVCTILVLPLLFSLS